MKLFEIKKYILTSFIVMILFSCSPKTNESDDQALASVTTEAPKGIYKLDKSHASLIFKVNHLGMSYYSLRFKKFDATLTFDPINPSLSSVKAEIDPTSIETDYPDKDTLDFNAELQNDKWLDAIKFPKIVFTSDKIELITSNSATVSGKLNLHGLTKTINMNVVFNGGYASNNFDSGSRIGFSAKGSLKRSEFGIITGIPEDGSNIGVGDDVEFIIEAEFTKP